MVEKIFPQAAFEMLQANRECMLIDVRSSMEFLFVGHPLRAINVAWIDEPEWEINPDFVAAVQAEVQRKFTTDPHAVALLLICRSGVRSVEAGIALNKAGFTAVFSVEEGFEGDIDDDGHRGFLGGWRVHGLPWVQC